MGRIRQILDESVAYGFQGGPKYKTNDNELDNGYSDRDGAWLYSRHEYNASFADIPVEARDRLIDVFHACRGALHAFMFKDFNDYSIVDQSIQVVPGTSDPIQLYKVYEFGEAYTVRPVQAIEWAEITDGAGSPVSGTLDPYTGIFTPSAPWGAGVYTLNADFYVWVRFQDDYNPMTINSWRNHTAEVDLIEDPFEFTATNVPASWDE